MYIATVNDVQLGEIVQDQERTPVVVLLLAAGDEGSLKLLRLVRAACEPYDSKVLFVKIWANEHPSWTDVHQFGLLPNIQVFKGGEKVQRDFGILSASQLQALLEEAIA